MRQSGNSFSVESSRIYFWGFMKTDQIKHQHFFTSPKTKKPLFLSSHLWWCWVCCHRWPRSRTVPRTGCCHSRWVQLTGSLWNSSGPLRSDPDPQGLVSEELLRRRFKKKTGSQREHVPETKNTSGNVRTTHLRTQAKTEVFRFISHDASLMQLHQCSACGRWH